MSLWAIPFGLDCRDCGGDVEELNRGQVIGRAEVRIIVRCTSCRREFVVEVLVHPMTGGKPARPGGDSVTHARST